jgi:SOS-response transcriptional repressor LexA
MTTEQQLEHPVKLGVTPVQKKVLDFLRDYIELHEYSPSMREIASGCKMTLSNAVRVTAALEKRQRITRLYGIARSISVLD